MANGPFDLGLGQTKPSAQGLDYLKPANVDLSGFEQAFSALGNIGAHLQAESDKMEDYKINTGLYDTKQRIWDRQTKLKQETDPSSTNIANDLHTAATEELDKFLATVPEGRRAELESELAPYKFQLHADGANFQHESNQNYYKAENNRIGDQIRVDVSRSPETFERRWAEYEKIVRSSGADPASTDAYLREQRRIFEKTAALSEGTIQKSAGQGTAADVAFFMTRAHSPEVTEQSAQRLNPAFSGRLQQVLQMAEKATGEGAKINELQRSPEVQAQYYANYKQQPIMFEGHMYTPKKKGGLAAAPGRSRHQRGNAADLADGKVLRWLRANRDTISANFGLEFLPGEQDIGHIQLKKSVDGYDSGGPPTANSFSALSNAVIQVESQGNPIAYSGAGAIGLMQLMPDTARGVARDLGIEVPTSDGDLRRYLEDPVNNRRLGEAYLKQMLERYDGDMEAALVAYNGGPARADAWLKSGRNDNILPDETDAYKDKVLGNLGTSPVDLHSNPSYSNLTYEDWVEIDRDSATRAKAQAAEEARVRKEEYGAQFNRVARGAQDGLIGSSEVEEFIESQPDMAYEDVAKLRKLVEDKNSAVNLMRAGQAKDADETAAWDPTRKEDKDMQSALFNGANGDEKLANGDMNYFNGEFLPRAMRSGMIAPDAASRLEGMVRSGNVTTMLKGAEFLSDLQDKAPLAYNSSVTNEDAKKRVAAWRAGRQVMEEGDLVKSMQGPKTAEEQKIYDGRMQEARGTQSNPSSAGYLSPEAVANAVDPAWLSTAPAQDLGGKKIEALMFNEASELYARMYAQTGDYEAAKTATYELMRQTWGVSSFGGNRAMMKYPPELGQPDINGGYEWMEAQARAEAAAAGHPILPGEKLTVMADSVTADTAVRSGGDPSKRKYKLFKQGTDGVVRMVYPDDQYVTFKPTEAMVRVKELEKKRDFLRQRRGSILQKQYGTVPGAQVMPRPQEDVLADESDVRSLDAQLEQLQKDMDAAQGVVKQEQPTPAGRSGFGVLESLGF